MFIGNRIDLFDYISGILFNWFDFFFNIVDINKRLSVGNGKREWVGVKYFGILK